MATQDRIPVELFDEKGHYQGRPADFKDKIIQRRVNLVKQVPNFINPNYNLLDIGCGNGASMFLLADQMNSCLGLEMEGAHQAAFEAYKKEHQKDNCHFQLWNIEKQKLDKQFDRLISFEVIEHLEDDINVKAYYDALKPGGMAIFTVPNKWWIFETHGANLPLLPWNRVPFFSWLPRPIHEKYANARIYTKKRIKRVVEAAGFRVESMKYVTAPMDVLPEGAIKKMLVNSLFKNDATAVPFLSTAIFVIAHKD